jgi:hypothetical protein
LDPKTTSRSKIVHFRLTIVGVGESLDEAFLDAVERLEDDPSSAVYGDVEWQGNGSYGDFKVVPIDDVDDVESLPDVVLKMFGVEKAEA